jgi:hypothetical protein
MNGKPVKAFMYQDHTAHMGVHISAAKDPKIMQIMGQNPQAQAIMAAAQAHIMEHVAFQYRAEIEQQLGAALPPMPDKDSDEDDFTLAPEVEVQLSVLVAQAAQQLLQKNPGKPPLKRPSNSNKTRSSRCSSRNSRLRNKKCSARPRRHAADAAGKADELILRETEINNRMEIDEGKAWC